MHQPIIINRGGAARGALTQYPGACWLLTWQSFPQFDQGAYFVGVIDVSHRGIHIVALFQQLFDQFRGHESRSACDGDGGQRHGEARITFRRAY